jgi:hypothetical protein
MTGESGFDASALLEYFAPLKAWLDRQNQGKPVGWPGDGAAAGEPAATSPAGRR